MAGPVEEAQARENRARFPELAAFVAELEPLFGKVRVVFAENTATGETVGARKHKPEDCVVPAPYEDPEAMHARMKAAHADSREADQKRKRRR
jgi:hypothetical protein